MTNDSVDRHFYFLLIAHSRDERQSEHNKFVCLSSLYVCVSFVHVCLFVLSLLTHNGRLLCVAAEPKRLLSHLKLAKKRHKQRAEIDKNLSFYQLIKINCITLKNRR